jgi:hypothetical protein
MEVHKRKFLCQDIIANQQHCNSYAAHSGSVAKAQRIQAHFANALQSGWTAALFALCYKEKN